MNSLRVWLPFGIVFLSVAAEMLLAGLGTGMGVERQPRAGLITALAGIAVVAVSTSLFWSMGLFKEAMGLRLVAAVPLALSLALTVVLMLEAHHHAGAQLGGGQ